MPAAAFSIGSLFMKTDSALEEAERFLHRQIPLTRAMQVRVVSYNKEALVLSAPLAPNHNHLGTAFGGSLAALAMLAGYSLLWLELEERAAHVVISKSEMRFLRPVTTELRASCQRPNESRMATFKEEFASQGKARISLEIIIGTKEEPAVIFTGLYVARR